MDLGPSGRSATTGRGRKARRSRSGSVICFLEGILFVYQQTDPRDVFLPIVSGCCLTKSLLLLLLFSCGQELPIKSQFSNRKSKPVYSRVYIYIYIYKKQECFQGVFFNVRERVWRASSSSFSWVSNILCVRVSTLSVLSPQWR